MALQLVVQIWKLCVGVLFVLLLLSHSVHAELEYECGDTYTDGEVITLSETDQVGTEVLLVNNTFSNLQYTVSYRNVTSAYLSSFFTMNKLGEHLLGIQLGKVIDLELLQVEKSIKLPDLSIEDLVFELKVDCRRDNGDVNMNLFTVVVKAVNEFPPFFLGAPFGVNMSEADPIGTLVYDLGGKAVDQDAGESTLTFKIEPHLIYELDGSRWVKMDPNVKGRIVLSESLDYESIRVREWAYFYLNVTVMDDGGHSTSTTIRMGVQDANDQGIEFVFPNCSRPCTDVNYTVNTNESYIGKLGVAPVGISCRDLDTLNSSIEYRLVPDDTAYFSVDHVTGTLSKTSALLNDTYGYIIDILVEAREKTNHDHSVIAEVFVFIDERRPRGAHRQSSSTTKNGHNKIFLIILY